jgi:hypothetical protein
MQEKGERGQSTILDKLRRAKRILASGMDNVEVAPIPPSN